jgi:hypothetical protein
VVEPSRKRGPFDPRWTVAKGRRHLRLVPELVDPENERAGVPAAASEDEASTDRGLASVTYLPTFIPPELERDCAGELAGRAGEEDLPGGLAAVAPVPKP